MFRICCYACFPLLVSFEAGCRGFLHIGAELEIVTVEPACLCFTMRGLQCLLLNFLATSFSDDGQTAFCFNRGSESTLQQKALLSRSREDVVSQAERNQAGCCKAFSNTPCSATEHAGCFDVVGIQAYQRLRASCKVVIFSC